DGRTSGIALGGINLEFIQPDVDAPEQAVCDTLVFEPTSLQRAEEALGAKGVLTRRLDKIEPDPALLALRGFEEVELQGPQLICKNLLLESEFPVPMFLCEYVPKLKQRLSASNPSFKQPHGRVLSITVQLAKPGAIWRLSDLGYQGNIELLQAESRFGAPSVIEIKFERGPVELQGIDPGFTFI
ncbi:MAG: hypothetical protein H7Y17_08190, partial [Chlorobia bacterium]|nr:hypothetical protein [Fimbriimonadaceae bacterium]